MMHLFTLFETPFSHLLHYFERAKINRSFISEQKPVNLLWLTFARLKTCVVESKSIALLPKQTIALLSKQTLTLDSDPGDREGFTKHAAALLAIAAYSLI